MTKTSITYTFDNVTEASAHIAALQRGLTTTARTEAVVKPDPTPAPPAAEKPAKEAKAEKPAKEAKAEPEVKKEEAKPLTYEQSGIGQKIADTVGKKPAEGSDMAAYNERRGKVVELLGKFGAKKGTDLKPDQFAEFVVAIDELARSLNEPAEELG